MRRRLTCEKGKLRDFKRTDSGKGIGDAYVMLRVAFFSCFARLTDLNRKLIRYPEYALILGPARTERIEFCFRNKNNVIFGLDF